MKLSLSLIKPTKGALQNVYHEIQKIRVFRMLNIKTHLNQAGIRKKDGYHTSHLLFILSLLPLLKMPTVHSFCLKKWYQWGRARKDAYYRFQRSPYRWRSFLYSIIMKISERLHFEKYPLQERYFILDDSPITKRGSKIENVSYIYDHSAKRTFLGFCIVSLGLFTGENFYPLDFAYRFGKKRHPRSPEEKIGDPRSISGRMSHEAKHQGKVKLGLQMIERAFDRGIRAGYVLFDSWYAWPSLIHAIRLISDDLHVICRLKDSKVLYEYQGEKYRLSELYQKVKTSFRKDARTGLCLKRVTVALTDSVEPAVIVFARGFHEPDEDELKGKKKDKAPKWVAFLSTDTRLHASSIIKKYTKRWTIEVCFKECKQLLGLGKDQSNDFNAQVFATTLSFLRYNLLNFLNQKENCNTTGDLFQSLVDESATITYAQRLWDFFRGLFSVAISKIFDLFEIEEQCSSYIDALSLVLSDSAPFQGCET
ncbi:MAG: transposase [Deltaproteobacteria bacterium]|nr:transposase [Deltaproteobacteria bacterium]